MKILVTGSAGHLGEALMRTLESSEHNAIGIDRLASPFTHHVASIDDRSAIREHMHGVDAVLHTATLHKPHVATHTNSDFVATNIQGTLTLLEEAVAAGVRSFVFTSTTSTFGRALSPKAGEPAAWITEDVIPVPKNIYGVTKVAAESLCELFHRNTGLPVLILKTSRFFPEEDDDPTHRSQYADDNSKANELLFRRVDIADAVDAHLLALQRARALGFGRYIISATSPFQREDLPQLNSDAPAVVRRYHPELDALFAPRGFRMFERIDRVYVNQRARADLGWRPRYDFQHILSCMRAGQPLHSELATLIGSKGYHRAQ
jgi:UDP-glucose 4-epimerase